MRNPGVVRAIKDDSAGLTVGGSTKAYAGDDHADDHGDH